MTWERDLDGARRRFAALDAERDFASALEHATHARFVQSFGGFFLPLPYVAQPILSLYGDFLDEPGEEWRVDRVHFDAHGRPVAHLTSGSPHHLWWWEGDGFVEIELMGGGPLVRRVRHSSVATASWADSTEVQLLTWRGGHAVRSDEARHSSNGAIAFAKEADYAADGTLLRIRRVHDERGPGDLRSALERAAALTPVDVSWDGRVQRPEPWPSDAHALVEPLAVALDAALRDAVATTPVEQPFLLEVFMHGARDHAFPPGARVIAADWRDRMRRSSRSDRAPISDTYEAVKAGAGAEFGLTDRLDDEALRACRVLSTAFHPTARWTRDPESDAVADAVGERLAELLHARAIPGTADPFLALVELGSPHAGRPGLERARRTAGADHFVRFMESVASRLERRATGATSVDRALHDRDALEAFLTEGGLPQHAARLAHEVAEVGFRLVKGKARSRLGGQALLPPGTEGPVSHEGRALTFLAGIDLAELPPSRLPAKGWLLYFADLGTGDGDGLIDEARNRPGSFAQVFFAIDDPVEAVPDAGDLTERRVVPKPFLTLPSGWGAGEAVGLDVYEGKTYEELASTLDQPHWTDDGHGHWIGGHVCGTQGGVDETGTTLLLHLEDDDKLGFYYLDAGTIQFRIAPDALAARDWSQIVAIAESS